MAESAAYRTQTSSPLGPLTITGSAHAVESVGWHLDNVVTTASIRSCALLDECARQLQAYFDGRLTAFDIPVAPTGTAFQQRVWQRLIDVSFGQTLSYGQLAQRLDPPTAPRAVGSAVGRNPISLILPCHRIVGSSGDLTGFAGGLDRKEWLLTHEGSILC
ncbi:methylated-DNA--[protein]-cysteine S-methyltransferase [Luminiphilus sp. nBUS_16]|uniref:methylated-DNA--[protein]-cysteine S-methyltransferase n=1 Tax=Luminiphilus sp. nBUS_16 TaxID=3395315 RepID=UPI003EB6B1B7